ncbi:MAG: hypothetical protein D6719_01755 [Candidatus Dadabacteria bacterium]|nr:MAG: hypothetical protein D6719_01755 [Candidatus Dadabacteria bacterium]
MQFSVLLREAAFSLKLKSFMAVNKKLNLSNNFRELTEGLYVLITGLLYALFLVAVFKSLRVLNG